MPPIKHYIQEIGKLLAIFSENLTSQKDIEDQLTVIKRVFRSQIDNDAELNREERQELCKILDYQTDKTIQPPLLPNHLPTGTIIYAKKDHTIWTKRNNETKVGIWESDSRTMNVQDQDIRENHYFEILYVPH